MLETSCKKTKHASVQKLGTPAIEERYIHQLKPSPSSKTYSPFPESCTHLSKPLGEGMRWGVVISASSKLFHLHSHCRGLLVVNLTNSVPLEFQPIQKLDSLQQHTDVLNSTRDGITFPENVIKFCLTFTKPKTSWILFIFHYTNSRHWNFLGIFQSWAVSGLLQQMVIPGVMGPPPICIAWSSRPTP